MSVPSLVRAAFVRRRIEDVAEAPVRHSSVQHIQNIFRETAAHLWLWTEDPRVPAENNAAELAVRPLAVACEVSHGSQSFKGPRLPSASPRANLPLPLSLTRQTQN